MRKPTAEEKQELTEYIMTEICGYNYDADEFTEMRNIIEDTHIVVFDNYITDSPGYAGKVIVVLWHADPSQVESYIYRDDKLTLAADVFSWE
jgi:hypothetical protein